MIAHAAQSKLVFRMIGSVPPHRIGAMSLCIAGEIHKFGGTLGGHLVGAEVVLNQLHLEAGPSPLPLFL